jgi:23S rRNA pseudouridine1911/1915/1917 synthase
MDTSPTLHLTIAPADDGRPLRELVVETLAGAAPSVGIPLDGETLMARGGLWVDGARERNMDALARAGAAVAIHRPLSGTYPDIVALTEQIIYEDDDLIVLNKPAGVYVDSTPWDAEGNYHAALDRLLAARDGAAPRTHLAHRLDRDTTGVLLVTKNPAVNPAIQSAFIHGKVHKEYLGLCAGALDADSFAITTGHGRGAHGLFRIYPAEEIGRVLINGARVKEMRTRFRVERRMEGLSTGPAESAALVRAFPETGRTHQIRLHLAHLGHPLLGDARYGGPAVWRGEPITHHLLHAELLALPHPRTRYRLEIVAPAPEWVLIE